MAINLHKKKGEFQKIHPQIYIFYFRINITH